MAKKKITAKKAPVKKVAQSNQPETKFSVKGLATKNRQFFAQVPSHLNRRTTIAVVVVFFLLGLFYFRRGWFVAASVNGQPIWRWEFNRTLNEQYASTVIDAMIKEEVIRQEAAKEGVEISPEAVDEQISQIEAGLGEQISLEEVLAMQNIKMEDLRSEIEYQLMLEQLLSTGIEITDEEISQYIEENADLLTAADEAGRIDEATKALRIEKMNEKYQAWFLELTNKAEVKNFITQTASSEI
jgi:hypothetical protein